MHNTRYRLAYFAILHVADQGKLSTTIVQYRICRVVERSRTHFPSCSSLPASPPQALLRLFHATSLLRNHLITHHGAFHRKPGWGTDRKRRIHLRTLATLGHQLKD